MLTAGRVVRIGADAVWSASTIVQQHVLLRGVSEAYQYRVRSMLRVDDCAEDR